jgi:hypothetical protein
MGMAVGRTFLEVCDEVWQWEFQLGETPNPAITEGMAAELAYAKKLGKPIKVFNTIGIPYEQWNSVKFADNPEALAELEKWETK